MDAELIAIKSEEIVNVNFDQDEFALTCTSDYGFMGENYDTSDSGSS